MTDISKQKLLYHLTNIRNLPSILNVGILSRNQLSEFVDVADQEILDSRKKFNLESYVPFHFLLVVLSMEGYS